MADIEGAAPRVLPLAQLTELQRAFESLLVGADPEAPVPSCGTWTVQELAQHLGSVHAWAAGRILGQKLQSPDPEALHPSVAGAHSAAARYRSRAELLRKTLSSVPSDQPCQTLTGEGPASFWQRRQTHETLIHVWDLCQALGSPMQLVPPEVWADCVAEVVQVMHPRQIQLGRVDAAQHRLLLIAENAGHQWLLPADATAESAAESAAEPSAVITASAAELALLLWGRGSLDGVNLSGDREAAISVLSGPLTP